MECTQLHMQEMHLSNQSCTRGQAVSADGAMVSQFDALLMNLMKNGKELQLNLGTEPVDTLDEAAEEFEHQSELWMQMQQSHLNVPMPNVQQLNLQLTTQSEISMNVDSNHVISSLLNNGAMQTKGIVSEGQEQIIDQKQMQTEKAFETMIQPKLQSTEQQVLKAKTLELSKLTSLQFQNKSENLSSQELKSLIVQSKFDGQAEQSLEFKHNYSKDLIAVKESMRNQTKAQNRNREEIPMNLLQQESASQKLTKLDLVQQKILSGQTEEKLLPQLTTGIQKHLVQDLQTFTLKLSPESLGEVTVTLTQEEGKTVLDIVTANSQTAKLINEELSSLRDSLRPMQVEVNRAQQSVQATNQSEQYSMMEQSFSHQERAFRWKHTPSNSENTAQVMEEEFEQQNDVQAVVSNAIYI